MMNNPNTFSPAEIPAQEPLPVRDPAATPARRLWRGLVDILETLILALVLFFAINLVTARIRVDGQSMEPTLATGQLVLVNKLAYRLGEPAIGDIVVFYFPRDPQQEYIKRLIGLPGDQVKIENGAVYVNGQALDEPYLAIHPAYTGNWTVPEGQIFVLGDNRNNSSDSHRWGTVPMEYIVGKAVVVYWPPADWKFLNALSSAQAAER
ncbi:MAG: signal peptidase I [Anaerolineales bacterium]|jgi:signal peptidase I|nr:signal peptidase I [Anaerolineales bacterium]